jgi:mannosyltransferase OCH1-like enzyme
MRFPPLPIAVPGDVPPTLHVIWVGSRVPAHIDYAWSMWESALPKKTWDVLRWTDDTLPTGFLSVLRYARALGLPPRGIADLLRLYVVALYGGVYVDSDTVYLRNFRSFADCPSWIGATEKEVGTTVLNNAVFGFSPGHPFLSVVWEEAAKALKRGVVNEHFVAGPRVFRKAIAKENVDLVFGFETSTKSAHQRMLYTNSIDREVLKEEFPDTPVLHIVGGMSRYVE